MENAKEYMWQAMTNAAKKAVELWQQAIALIWLGRCGLCHSQGVAGHHIFGRRFKEAKFCVMNGIYVCLSCHEWADKNDKALLAVLEIKYPALYLWHIEHEAEFNTQVKWHTTSYYKEKVDELRQVIADLT